MKVFRQGINSNYAIYLIYDENNPIVEKKDFVNEEHEKTYKKLMRTLYGASYGFKKICYFTVYISGKINYEFDSYINYSGEDLRTILRKAGNVKNRLMRQWSNNG